jgi:hypothetical protein
MERHASLPRNIRPHPAPKHQVKYRFLFSKNQGEKMTLAPEFYILFGTGLMLGRNPLFIKEEIF